MTYNLDLLICLRYDDPEYVPNIRSVGQKVQPAERKETHKNTDRYTDATENITFSANAGAKNLNNDVLTYFGMVESG